MVSVNKLKGKVMERGLTLESLAEKTGIEKSRLYRRLKEPGQFTVAEVDSIVSVLCLSIEEAIDIFFVREVA